MRRRRSPAHGEGGLISRFSDEFWPPANEEGEGECFRRTQLESLGSKDILTRRWRDRFLGVTRPRTSELRRIFGNLLLCTKTFRTHAAFLNSESSGTL